jgi:hypothetical protein
MQKQIDMAIKKGLQYLAAQQKQDGSFVSYLSLDRHISTTDIPVKTTFVSSLILASIADIDTSASNNIRQNIAAFLLSQKSSQWTLNFLANDDPQRYIRNYPDDLDDTFCAYIALHAHNPKLITTELLVSMVRILLATETAPGGPYRTWLAPPDSAEIWLDIDIAVNSNIAYFLSLVTKLPDSLYTYIEQSLAHSRLSSPYYVPIYPIVYYLSRFYAGSQKQKLLKFLSEAATLKELSALECALSVCAMIRLLGKDGFYRDYIDQLIGLQNQDGSWPADAFCTDELKSSGLYYNGCSALTTGFALEALRLYQKNLTSTNSKTVQKKSKEQITKKAVLRIIEKDCEILDEPLKTTFLHTLNTQINSKNGGEIVRFAHAFNASLQKPLVDHTTFLDKLGAANSYGWSAYTIYDDFLDDEGKPLLLSSANTALRLSYEHFLQAVPNKVFQTHVRHMFGLIDNANTWEVSNCRFPVYKKRTIVLGDLPYYGDLFPLANRSIGHALGPLAVLARSGIMPNSADFQSISSAIKHYIIAKQLNDDAHDWQEDFVHGHITYVVATLLEELAVPNGTYKLHELLPVMQKHFWHNTLTTICSEIKNQTDLSRKVLKATSVLKKENVIARQLDSIEASLRDTLAKQAQTKEFLEQF